MDVYTGPTEGAGLFISMNFLSLSLFAIYSVSFCAEQKSFSLYEEAVKASFQVVAKDLASPKLDPEQCPTTMEFAHFLSSQYLSCKQESYQYMNAGCFSPNFEEILHLQGIAQGRWFNDEDYSAATGVDLNDEKSLDILDMAIEDIANGRRKVKIGDKVFNPFFIIPDVCYIQNLKSEEHQARANNYAEILSAVDEDMLISVLGLTHQQILDQIDALHAQYDALENKVMSESDYYQATYNRSKVPKFCFYQSPALSFKLITVGTSEPSRLDEVARLAISQSNTLSSFFGVAKAVDIDLVLFKSLAQKKLPNTGEPFNYGAVNSARTYSDEAPPCILMFRMEEFEKVLFHELSHHVLGSKGWCDSPLLGKKSLNETFVETLAVVSHCSLKASSTGHFDQHHFISCIEDERRFSSLQSAKVLLHAGYTTYDEFLTDLASQSRVKGNPATIEYHVYKSASLFNLERFMVSAKVNRDDPKILTQLVIDSLQEFSFKEAMAIAFQVVRQLSTQGHSELASTMRMTIS